MELLVAFWVLYLRLFASIARSLQQKCFLVTPKPNKSQHSSNVLLPYNYFWLRLVWCCVTLIWQWNEGNFSEHSSFIHTIYIFPKFLNMSFISVERFIVRNVSGSSSRFFHLVFFSIIVIVCGRMQLVYFINFLSSFLFFHFSIGLSYKNTQCNWWASARPVTRLCSIKK